MTNSGLKPSLSVLQEVTMKKLLVGLLILIGFIGCSNEQEETLQNTDKDGSKVATNDKQEETTKEEITKQNENKEKADKQSESKEENNNEITLLDYRPEVGAIKKFFNQDTLILTEHVIAENDQYLQRVIYLGDAATVQVLRWTEEEITIVHEDSEVTNPTENILSDFENLEHSHTETNNNEGQTLIGQSADWELVQSDAEVETPVDSFKNVYVIQKVTKEIEGSDTVYTYYFAPKIGLIKETFEVTGEQGYKEESILTIVE
jgi:hypothetical protein